MQFLFLWGTKEYILYLGFLAKSFKQQEPRYFMQDLSFTTLYHLTETFDTVPYFRVLTLFKNIHHTIGLILFPFSLTLSNKSLLIINF